MHGYLRLLFCWTHDPRAHFFLLAGSMSLLGLARAVSLDCLITYLCGLMMSALVAFVVIYNFVEWYMTDHLEWIEKSGLVTLTSDQRRKVEERKTFKSLAFEWIGWAVVTLTHYLAYIGIDSFCNPRQSN
jgi:hypothetical protein